MRRLRAESQRRYRRKIKGQEGELEGAIAQAAGEVMQLRIENAGLSVRNRVLFKMNQYVATLMSTLLAKLGVRHPAAAVATTSNGSTPQQEGGDRGSFPSISEEAALLFEAAPSNDILMWVLLLWRAARSRLLHAFVWVLKP